MFHRLFGGTPAAAPSSNEQNQQPASQTPAIPQQSSDDEADHLINDTEDEDEDDDVVFDASTHLEDSPESFDSAFQSPSAPVRRAGPRALQMSLGLNDFGPSTSGPNSDGNQNNNRRNNNNNNNANINANQRENNPRRNDLANEELGLGLEVQRPQNVEPVRTPRASIDESNNNDDYIIGEAAVEPRIEAEAHPRPELRHIPLATRLSTDTVVPPQRPRLNSAGNPDIRDIHNPGIHHRGPNLINQEAQFLGRQESRRERNRPGTIPAGIKPGELDQAVMLAIEAAKTHEMVRMLFRVCTITLAIAFLFLMRLRFYDPFETSSYKEEGIILVYYKAHYVMISSVFEAVFAVLVVATVAFKEDFPFNLSILICSFFYAGFLFGTVVQRSGYLQLDDDFTCVPEDQ